MVLRLSQIVFLLLGFLFLLENLSALGTKEAESSPENPSPIRYRPIEETDDGTSKTFQRHGASFVPVPEHAEFWNKLDSMNVVDSLVYLERMARHPSLSDIEKNIIYLELGNRCYDLRLFDQAYSFFSLVSLEFLRGRFRLRFTELGVYYKNWKPSQTISYIKGIDPHSLDNRDRDIFSFLLSRSLWEKIDIEKAGMTDPSLSALALDGEDVWGGTWNGGIFRYTRSSEQVTVLRPGQFKLIPNAITSIHVDRFGVWFAALDGIFRYNKVTGEWSNLTLPSEIQPERIQRFARLMGTFYLATAGHGLWRYVNNGWEKIELGRVGPNINGAFPKDDQTFFLATRDRGLFAWNPSTNVLEAYSTYGGAPVNVIAVAQIGRDIWVGTYGEGLFRFDSTTKRWQRFSQSNGDIPDDWVMAVSALESTLILGTFGGGMAVKDDSGFKFLKNMGSPRDVVAIQPHRDRLYLATLRDGLWIFNMAGYREIAR